MATITLEADAIREKWREAWNAYSAARHLAEEYDRNVFTPAYEACQAATGGKLQPVEWRHKIEREAVPDWDAIAERMDELNAAAYAHLHWNLVLTPAPDREALEWKISELFGGEGDHSACWRMDGINAFLADVRRLLS